MSNTHNALLQQLTDTLSSMQNIFAAGVSEYELISMLKAEPYCLFDDDALQDSLLLFQTHFVLFHALYLLRNTWQEQQFGELNICGTRIQLQLYKNTGNDSPISNAPNSLAQPDPLAAYYLDWQNLASTGQQDVEEMLDNFWINMTRFNGRADAFVSLTDDDVLKAKDTLRIEHNAMLTLSSLKQQYRKLQHQYHPDKGGTSEQSQAILMAYKRLQTYVKQSGHACDDYANDKATKKDTPT